MGETYVCQVTCVYSSTVCHQGYVHVYCVLLTLCICVLCAMCTLRVCIMSSVLGDLHIWMLQMLYCPWVLWRFACVYYLECCVNSIGYRHTWHLDNIVCEHLCCIYE